MKILLTSSEAVPFAKVGGLADVVGSLPTALRNLDVDARVSLSPATVKSIISSTVLAIYSNLISIIVAVKQKINLYTCVYNDIPFYFITGMALFRAGRIGLYSSGRLGYGTIYFFQSSCHGVQCGN